MAAVDNTAASNYLKNRFHPKRIQNLSYEGSPLFAMVPKKTDFGGDNLKVPVSYADLKGRSSDFSVAQANKQGSDTARFLITTVKDYALFSIQGQTIKQSRGDLNAWLPALEKEADSAARALARSTSWAMYRDSAGDVAQCNITASDATITLLSRSDIQNFEAGMTVQAATKSGSTATVRSGKLKIVSVDRDAGTMEANVAVDTGIPAIADSDYLIPEGDANARLSGLSGWLPATAPTSGDSFFSQDRSSDATRLAGIRFDASGMNILEAIIDAAARAGENGAAPTHLFLNFDKWRELCNYLGSQKTYTQGTAYAPSGQPKADVGFEGVKLHGPNSVIEVYADRHCPASTGYMLQMSSWCLHSTGGVPMLLEEDGQSILREATDDAYEGRWGAYYQMYCDAPGKNVRISNL